MVDPTHVIVLMVPLGATLDVSRVAEVAVSAGAEIVAATMAELNGILNR